MAQREFRQIYPAAGLGRARPERDLGRRSSRPRARRWRKAGLGAARHRRDRHHQPARDHAGLEPRAPASRSHNAIVWQDRRTEPAVRRAARSAASSRCSASSTGLVIDAYFSGTKLAWLLDHVAGARARAARGELAFGTVDTLADRGSCTGGARCTPPTSATPRARCSSTSARGALGRRAAGGCSACRARCCPRCIRRATCSARPTPSCSARRSRSRGIAGDQQSALFGQACFSAGHGEEHLRHRLLHADAHRRALPRPRANGLVTTPRRAARRRRREYALEGSVFIAGAVVQWLRDGLRAITAQRRGRGARRERARHRRRDVRAGLHRPGRAATGTPTRAAPSSA